MKSGLLTILFFLLVASPYSLPADHVNVSSPDEDDRKQILKVLTYYFYGEHLHAIDELARAYHPQAYLTYIDVNTGNYQKFHIGSYLSQLAETPREVMERDLKIVDLDITGNAAMVKTQLTYSNQGKRINDYLSATEG